MISPQDLRRNAFTRSLKGYAVAEVDEYIAFLLEKYNESYNEYQALQQKYNMALEQLDEAKNEESTISAIIVNAQKMADAIVADAKEKANNIRSSVTESCDEILVAYREKAAKERDKLVQCEKAVEEFKNSLYEAYKKHLTMIDNLMPDDDVTPYNSDEELEEKAVELAEAKLKKGDAGEDMTASLNGAQQKESLQEENNG